MSRCVSWHEPLKVQNPDGKSSRIFQSSSDQAMAYTRCVCPKWAPNSLKVKELF
ncbi:MAG: hypothetical protein ACI8YQ_005041 [Polaribacter sp.]|jgi:hypothetical protein